MASVAFAQAPADPPPSSVVSKSVEAAPDPVKHSSIKLDNGVAEPSDAIAVDPASLLPDLPPVPHANATLIGGTIERLDRVRDRITLNVFGGGKATALFDPRTKIYRGTKEGTIADLREGERAYLDTILDGSTVFAKSIRLSGPRAMGESRGVVLTFRPDREELTFRDGLSPAPVRIRTNASTKFMKGSQLVSPNSLADGSLVAVTFSSEGSGHDVAQEISILAAPGSQFVFAGKVLHIDLRSGLLVIESATDHKTYEIYMDPSRTADDNLHTGANVTVMTTYQDAKYVARNVSINQPSPQNAQ